MKQEIEFGKRCVGCKWAQYKCGRWECCNLFLGTRFRRRPEPDGSGGCKHYEKGKRVKIDIWGHDENDRKKGRIHRGISNKHRLLSYAHLDSKRNF